MIHPHAEPCRDARDAILAILVDRLGGRVVVSDEELAEAFRQKAKCTRHGNETILESIAWTSKT